MIPISNLQHNVSKVSKSHESTFLCHFSSWRRLVEWSVGFAYIKILMSSAAVAGCIFAGQMVSNNVYPEHFTLKQMVLRCYFTYVNTVTYEKVQICFCTDRISTFLLQICISGKGRGFYSELLIGILVLEGILLYQAIH